MYLGMMKVVLTGLNSSDIIAFFLFSLPIHHMTGPSLHRQGPPFQSVETKNLSPHSMAPLIFKPIP